MKNKVWIRTDSIHPGSGKNIKRLTIDIPSDLHKAIKLRSVEASVSMTDLIREILEKNFT